MNAFLITLIVIIILLIAVKILADWLLDDDYFNPWT